MKRRRESLSPSVRRISVRPPRAVSSARQSQVPPACLLGFEGVDRFWDRTEKVFAARLLPGEYYVTRSNEMILTILGSCVSACIRDKYTGLGGMNHFLLPLGKDDSKDPWSTGLLAASARYGNFAMEKLINELLSRGARREGLEVKIVGGGKMWASSQDVGAKNINFVRAYLQMEKLAVAGEDLGGTFPRRVHYFPATGIVRVKKLGNDQTTVVERQEKEYLKRLDGTEVKGDVDLF